MFFMNYVWNDFMTRCQDSFHSFNFNCLPIMLPQSPRVSFTPMFLILITVFVACCVSAQSETTLSEREREMKSMRGLGAIGGCLVGALAGDSPENKAFQGLIGFFVGALFGPLAFIYGMIYTFAKLWNRFC